VEKPLVTIAVITYNQARYISETLDGCFAQTYSPLEILICDDGSTDDTIKIVERKIQEYKNAGGVHSVVFHKNEKNLGILRNFEQCFEFAKGELLVHNGGDDISYPNRVERIVDAWLAADKKPKMIAHGYDRIDTDGNMLTPVCLCKSANPMGIDLIYRLGACVAYSRDICERFQKSPERTSEDWVMESRVYMLGMALDMPERLSKYRFGSGLSTRSFRDSRIGTADRLQVASKVIWRDLETARQWLTEERIAAIRSTIERRIKIREDWRKLLRGKTYKDRKAAYDAGAKLCLTFDAPEFVRRILLLPAWLGDPLIKVCERIAYLHQRILSRRIMKGASHL